MLLSGQSNEVTSRSPTAHLSATPWVATFSLSPDDFSACLVPLDLHHHHLPPGLLSSLLGLLPPPLQAGFLYNPHLQSRVFPSQIRAPRQALHFLTTSPTHFVSHIYSLLLSHPIVFLVQWGISCLCTWLSFWLGNSCSFFLCLFFFFLS